jgi:serine protease DegQ
MRIRLALAVLASAIGVTILGSTGAPAEPASTRRPLVVEGYADILAPVLPSVVQVLLSPGDDGIAETAPKIAARALRRFPFGATRFLASGPEEERSSGSGVVIDAAGGLVLTNHHVIADGGQIDVRLPDGRTIAARLMGSDADTDVALLKIEAPGLVAAPRARPDSLRVGDVVLALGYPYGLEQTLSMGIVSGLSRSTGDGGYEDFIQTDAALNPGSSGGALLNSAGELIGITSSGFSSSAGDGGNVGINYAIPLPLALAISDQILRHGNVARGHLGARYRSVDPDLAGAMGLPVTRGALITRVTPGSAAEVAGLAPGDIVIVANDRQLRSGNDLHNALGVIRPGTEVTLHVRRGAALLKLQARLQERVAAGQSSFRGAVVTAMPQGRTAGVLVADVTEGSPAAAGGLQAGDVILRVNQSVIADIGSFKERTARLKGAAALSVVRNSMAAIVLIDRR